MEDKEGKISSELIKFLKVDINAMYNELFTPGTIRKNDINLMTQQLCKVYENDDFENRS
ncbi:MAG: hypothetical protein FWG89_08305 [Treponema sp.]|nr:hypothetical protein [Treponema sp.]